MDRRQFNQTLLAAGAAAMAPATLRATETPLLRGKAQSCIFLWLGGGMAHVDTFDPKRLGDPVERKAGSAYQSIPTAISDVQVCEHLRRTADLLDLGVILRTLHHGNTNEHAGPTNLFKTGRLPSGTIVYPSIGSIISHELGPRTEGVPPYVVMGYPNVTRGPGFLGARYSYIYLTDTKAGPNGLRLPDNVSLQRSQRRLELLERLRAHHGDRLAADAAMHEYDETIHEALRMASPEFTRVFDLQREPDSLRNRYGDEFGQRCLLARRLVQSGVRFVEVAFNLNFLNGTGWDTHGKGQEQQHLLIQGLDQSLTALLEDLERNKLLDETLVVVATEFGRPPQFDGAGGRGHQAKAFSTVLFGGGLKTGQAIGVTDELGGAIVSDPMSVPDFHANIHAALGIDPSKELYAGDRPVPITDHGHPHPRLFG